MSALTTARLPKASPGGSGTAVTMRLAGRSLMLVTRVPSTFVPSLVFPLIILTAFTGAFGSLTKLPGFPVPSMIDWILPMTVVQGAAFAGVTVALGSARDLETGFYDRLALGPYPRYALVAGPLAAALARGFISIPPLIVVGLLAGAHLPGGFAGAVLLTAAGLGLGVPATAWSLALALRIRSQRAGPLMQLPVFVAVFLSTAQVPLDLMSGWLHAVARVNPVTNILAMARQGFIGHVTWAQTWPGLVAIAALSVPTVLFAARSLRKALD